MRKIICSVLLAVLFLSAIANAQTQTTAVKVTFIKAGKLIDTESGKVLTNQTILIENDTIKAVGANLTIPAGATVIDLSNATVMPGFINTHTHITGEADENYYDMFRKTFVDSAITAHINARKTLDAGFTTIRDVGSGGNDQLGRFVRLAR